MDMTTQQPSFGVDTTIQQPAPLNVTPSQQKPADSSKMWGDALIAMSNLLANGKRPQAPGIGGVQGLGRSTATASPFGGAPPSHQIRPISPLALR